MVMTNKAPNGILGKTILVVDGESDIREILAFQLQQQGAHVIEAASLLEALAQLKHVPVDAIVTESRFNDCGEPCKVIELLRSSGSRAPCVFMTAFAETSEYIAYEAGAQALFYKPTHLKTFGEFMARALAEAPGRLFRKSERYVSYLEGEISFLQGSYSAWVLNLSLGGMFLQSSGYLPKVNEEFTFHVNGKVQIEGKAIVRWVRSQDESSLMRGFGVEFQNLSSDSQEALERFVNEQRTKG